MVPGCPSPSRAHSVQACHVLLATALCLLPGKAIRIRDPSAIAEADADVDLSEITFPTSCYTEQMGFDEFCRTFGRTYQPGSAEYHFRKGLFELHTVAAQMQNCKLGSKWTAGVNKHADWTEDELASLRGYKRSSRSRRQSQSVVPGSSFLLGRRVQTSVRRASSSASADLPESVSWHHLASIQAERDQGQCGSCWAHTAETVMRAHSEIHVAKQNFSVDELISCVPNPQECGGQGGCLGATIELAFDYVMRHGLSLEQEGSESVDEVACPAPKLEDFVAPVHEVFLEDGREVHMLGDGSQDGNHAGTRINMFGWTKLPENKEEPMLRALVELGPLAVAVAAGWQWNLYKAGIMAVEDSCQDQVITHAVVLFGYGSEDGTKYWHLKNSWGSWWGEDGFIRLQRMDKEEEHCAWDNKPEVGTGCLGGPPQVWVCGACGILYDAAVPHFRPLDIPKEAHSQDMW